MGASGRNEGRRQEKQGEGEGKKKSGGDRGCFNLRVDVLAGLSTGQPLEIPGGFRPSVDFRSGKRVASSRGQFIACTRKSAGKKMPNVS